MWQIPDEWYQIDLYESTKVLMIGVGVATSIYTICQTFFQTAPVRVWVNPHRYQLLLAGLLVLIGGYGLLAVQAGNKWSLADVGREVLPVLTQQKTDEKVRSILTLCFLIGFLPVVLSVWCCRNYPRDSISFPDGQALLPPQVVVVAKEAIAHYTRQLGGLDYAAVIVFDGQKDIPYVEDFLRTANSPTPGPIMLLDCLDLRDLRITSQEFGVNPEDYRRFCLEISRGLYQQMVAHSTRTNQPPGGLRYVISERVRTRQGGMLIEYLHPAAKHEGMVVLVFGVTVSPVEERTHRFDEHFEMLVRTLRRVIPDAEAIEH